MADGAAAFDIDTCDIHYVMLCLPPFLYAAAAARYSETDHAQYHPLLLMLMRASKALYAAETRAKMHVQTRRRRTQNDNHRPTRERKAARGSSRQSAVQRGGANTRSSGK